jgi:hypothetical protein
LALYDENSRLKKQPMWYAAFGASWKYWPGTKRFDPYPYCNCRNQERCQILPYQNDWKVDLLICPEKVGKYDAQFSLRALHGNHLSIRDALERLAHVNPLKG